MKTSILLVVVCVTLSFGCTLVHLIDLPKLHVEYIQALVKQFMESEGISMCIILLSINFVGMCAIGFFTVW